jgi:beta-lactamase superfamily II metal-dependent hydrolase
MSGKGIPCSWFRRRESLLIDGGDAFGGKNSTDLHADVLKVGHHGRKNSSTQEFLDAVAPAIAIISGGKTIPMDTPARNYWNDWKRAAPGC